MDRVSSPYSFSWDTNQVSNGPHTISVISYGNNGAKIGADSLSVTVANGSILWPALCRRRPRFLRLCRPQSDRVRTAVPTIRPDAGTNHRTDCGSDCAADPGANGGSDCGSDCRPDAGPDYRTDPSTHCRADSGPNRRTYDSSNGNPDEHPNHRTYRNADARNDRGLLRVNHGERWQQWNVTGERMANDSACGKHDAFRGNSNCRAGYL